jgi:uncharacterized protein (TIGR00369 family)
MAQPLHRDHDSRGDVNMQEQITTPREGGDGLFGLVPLDVASRQSGIDFLRAMMSGTYPSPPAAGTAGIWITEVEFGRVVFEARPSERFYNPLGTVHGGWISTLLDSAMGCAVHSTLEAAQLYTTVDMTISFVRAVSANTGKLRCEGKIVHSGSRIGTAEGRVWDQMGKLLAHGTETCIILPATPSTAALNRDRITPDARQS